MRATPSSRDGRSREQSDVVFEAEFAERTTLRGRFANANLSATQCVSKLYNMELSLICFLQIEGCCTFVDLVGVSGGIARARCCVECCECAVMLPDFKNMSKLFKLRFSRKMIYCQF